MYYSHGRIGLELGLGGFDYSGFEYPYGGTSILVLKLVLRTAIKCCFYVILSCVLGTRLLTYAGSYIQHKMYLVHKLEKIKNLILKNHSTHPLMTYQAN